MMLEPRSVVAKLFAVAAAIRTRSRESRGIVARISLIRELSGADERERERRMREGRKEKERPKLARSKQRVAGERVNKGPRILLATVCLLLLKQ